MSTLNIVGPTEGRAFEVMGDRVVVKTPGSETDGRFTLLEFDTPKEVGPPPHSHAWREGYWVLEGELELMIDGKTQTLSPGSWVLVPGGTIHTSKALSERTRYLMFAEPAGVEDFLLEVQEGTADDPGNLETILAIAARHGFEVAAPA
jgi:quercetin dioxygenase-like cupin family protein